MARVVEGFLAVCLMIIGYGIFRVFAVRPLRRAASARRTAEPLTAGPISRNRGKPVENRESDLARHRRPQGPVDPAGSATNPGSGAVAQGPCVEQGIIYAERLEFSIVRAGSADAAGPRYRVAVKRDLAPCPVRYGDPAAVERQAQEEPDFRARLVEGAADYFTGEYGDPVVAWASSRVWVTGQSYPETDLAEVCSVISDRLTTLVERPLTMAGSELGIPAPLVAPAAGIGAGLILEPVTGPLADAARFFEIAGVAIGVLAGLHPLVLASAKLLARGELHQRMASGLEKFAESIFRGKPLPLPEPGDQQAVTRTPREQEHPQDRPLEALDHGQLWVEPVHVRESTRTAAGRPDAHEEPWVERERVRESLRMTAGRPDTREEPWVEPDWVREPHRRSSWAARDDDDPARTAGRHRDDDEGYWERA